jgi:hypothetical protein
VHGSGRKASEQKRLAKNENDKARSRNEVPRIAIVKA